MKTPPDMMAAALWYADQGAAVLPLHYPVPIRVSDYTCSCSVSTCKSPAKHPIAALVPHGLEDATTDPQLITKWWRAYPAANIGLRTGEIFDALDLDGPNGFKTYARMVAELGDDVEALAVVRTGRVDGGRQHYCQPAGERTFAGGKIGVPGVDCRGTGGYVVAVPSRHISGRRYEWITRWGSNGHKGASWTNAYKWLTDQRRPDEPQTPPAAPAPPVDAAGTAYGLAALRAESDKIRSTPAGGRNDQLNTSAFSLGQLVAGGQLDKTDTVEQITAAALAAGLDERETRRTIESGMPKGEAKPRAVPTPTRTTPAAAAAVVAPVAHSVERIDEQWETPEAAPDPPLSFPLHILGPLGDVCETLTDEMQTPPDLVGMLTLATVAATIRGRVHVQVRPSWVEPLNLYVCVVANVGETKSPTLAPIVAPLRRIEAELQAEARTEISLKDTSRRIQEDRARKAETAASRATGNDRAIAEHNAHNERAILDELIVPPLPRLLAGDMTPEALVQLLAEQGGVLASLSAEGGLFDTLAGGRYSNGMANLDAVLQAFDGREPILVDRKTGDPLRVEHPCLTLGLAIQPRVLERVGSNEDATGRGLLARFLYAVPPPRVGRRDFRRPTTTRGSECFESFEYVIRRLNDISVSSSEDYEDVSYKAKISLSSSSIDLVHEYWQELEARRHPDTGDLVGMIGWAAKLNGQVIRLAGLLHLLYLTDTRSLPKTYSKSSQLPEIGTEATTNACLLTDYLIEHAKRAHLLMVGRGPDGQAHTRQVLRWAIDHQDDNGEFTVREAHQALRGRVTFNDVQYVHAMTTELANLGHIRLLAVEPRPGRPPSPRYRLHPNYRRNGGD